MGERTFRTKLEHQRWLRHETQESMSAKTGIKLRTYRRLENGQLHNPPIRYLVNCALALNAPLQDVCETEWLTWTDFVAEAPAPAGRHYVKLHSRAS